MGMRRDARERAVQFLFQYDLNKPENLEESLKQFWDSQQAAAIAEDKGRARWGETLELPPPTSEEAAMRLFAEPLIRGTLEKLKEIDGNGAYEVNDEALTTRVLWHGADRRACASMVAGAASRRAARPVAR